jgi:hypothetical protein
MANDEDGSPNDRDDRVGGRGLPPGIAKKEGFLPPGIAKQEEQQHHGRHHHHHQHEKHITAQSHTRVDLGNSNAAVTLHGQNITVIGQDGSVTVTGAHTSHDRITLGNGDDHVSLSGNHNKITLGNGNDSATLDGHDNKLTLGNGDDAVALSPFSSNNTIIIGSGHDTITTTAGDTRNTFSLDASTSSLLLHGTDNKVFINGGSDTITDTALSPTGGDHLTLNVGSLGGSIDITNFSVAHGVVDLVPGLGFASDAAAAAAVTSDGHGGSMLAFAGGLGSIDFQGVSPASLHSTNFHIA